MRRMILGGALLLAPVALSAQQRGGTRLTLEFGMTRFHGGVRDTSSPPVYIRPFRPTLVTLRLAGPRFGIAVTIAGAPTGYSQGSIALLQSGDLSLLEIAPEVRTSVARSTAGGRLVVHVGPLLDLWKSDLGGSVARFGGHAGATLELPVSGRMGVSLRGDAAVTGSQIADDALSPDLSQHTMWRTRFGIGAVYRLGRDDG
ncbi:MAG TPA: hypothetical protein VFI39_06400 [Gemmatimonadales bacterium]|nr:hypothetical protein [Gemmatimonadales bacterium]